MASQIIPFPQEYRPTLPTIVGNVDYLTLRQRLEQMDALLQASGAEREFVRRALAQWNPGGAKAVTARQQVKFQQRSRRALRCTLLRTLLQEDYRGFSIQLAGNPLYQWFCLVDAIDLVKVPSKSELQRFAHWLPADALRAVLDGLLKTAVDQPQTLQLQAALDLEAYFLDSTCLPANIHFPTDWVLLRDGVTTLMKATRLIRRAGLRRRMAAPAVFLRRINQLSIAMSAQARRSGSKQGRKRVLRQMKQLVKVVRGHARRHRELLDQAWAQTEWTRPQAEQILRRLDGVLALLPRAQKQAHERIIGGRPVANADKLLSLYEPDVRVTEAAARLLLLTYNLWTLFVRLMGAEPGQHVEAVRSRRQFLVLAAQLVRTGRQKVWKLAVSQDWWATLKACYERLCLWLTTTAPQLEKQRSFLRLLAFETPVDPAEWFAQTVQPAPA